MNKTTNEDINTEIDIYIYVYSKRHNNHIVVRHFSPRHCRICILSAGIIPTN